jgi:hypothetical protein
MNCINCKEKIKVIKDQLIMKEGRLCSVKCNNQWIGKIREKEEKIRCWHHYQKLRNWLEARGWLIFNFDKNHRYELGWSYSLGDTFCHCYNQIKEGKITISLAVPGLAIWLHLETLWYGIENREIGIRIHNYGIYWNLWTDDNERYSKLRNGNWYPLDTLFGRMEYSQEKVKWEEVIIAMPEGNYKARAKCYNCYWKRKIGFKKKRKRVEIEIENGIPVPGKGTESYNCGEDAVYSITMNTESVEEGIGKLVTSILETRKRYGGNRDWEPEKLSVKIN